MEQKNIDAGGSSLLIFTRNACMKRELPNLQEGIHTLFLAGEDRELPEDVRIKLVCREGVWRIADREINDSSPFYFYTEKKEKLLLLPAKKPESLKAAGRIPLSREEKLKIGSAFKNQIFYDCFSLIESVHVEIAYEEEGYMISAPGHEGVYLNEKALKGKQKLQKGDRIDLYGLHLLFLDELLICACFHGVCRVVKGGRIKEKPGLLPAEHKEEGEEWIERSCGTARELHTEEVEVILPDKLPKEQAQPLVLSLGPSVTMVVPMLLMAWLGKRYMGETGSGFYAMSVAMSGCTAFLSVFWGIAAHGYRKHLRKRSEREKVRQYREYLKETEDYLLRCRKENREILEMKYPPSEAVLLRKETVPFVLWNRYYRQKDFLFLRLGTGEIPFQVKVRLSESHKSIVQRKLVKEAQELAERHRTLDNVPVGVDLYENRQIGVLGDFGGEGVCGVLLQILMQIAACHCYTEVKVACFYRKDRKKDQEIAESLKWLPHSWAPDKGVRFLAGNEREAGEILPVLIKELDGGRKEADKGVRLPWYIILVLNRELIRGETLYGYLTEPGAYPVSTVFVGKRREELPKSCRYFIKREGQAGEILELSGEQVRTRHICLEACDSFKAEAYFRRLAGLKVREGEADKQLPEQVSFLSLFKCSKVEELESGLRWQQSRCEERLKVPIGCSAGGNSVSLDVHEKFHGPHGLIAGTTGSGKSELLQTYLLSIAVSFSPLDVNFFMIDYKGGGTGNLLKDLPHCAGVISNLSGKQIKRAMSAITSENKRRQKLLGEFQVNHIDAYTGLFREGKASEPMPHLLLVVDEFAELKKEEPEFMQEIISLAQVGRSLGVHLLLATQKPAGTVDDKIWSNARFRLCLRVQDRQDSMDMLHNSDAAFLTQPGQCYLQIGNNEYYELFKAGYCGGIYRKEGEKKARAVLLSDTGKRWEREEAKKEKGKSQLEVLVDYVNQIAEKYGYPDAASLWLPELPGKIGIEDLGEAGGKQELEILLGLCDDPENQCQFVLDYRPAVQGHLAVFGGPATGKTTLLQTILWQLANSYSPEETVFLTAAPGQKGIDCFRFMPHCLGALKEKEDKDIFFCHLKRFADNRKKQLCGISCEQYNRTGGEKLPLVFLVIDNYGGLRKILGEDQEEFLEKLAAEGLTLGIYLIFSASGVGEIGGKLFEKIKMTLALEMSDRFQYGDILRQYALPVLPKENQKGRGLCKVQGRILEFQSALPVKDADDYTCMKKIEETGKKKEQDIRSRGKQLPRKFPVIPRKADFQALIRNYDWSSGRLPLGYDLATGEICVISPEKAPCFLISGSERTGRTALLSCLLEGALYQKYRVVVIDTHRKLKDFAEQSKVPHKEMVYLEEEKEIDAWQKAFEKEEPKKGEKVSVFISDMGSFCRYLYGFGEMREEKAAFWEQAAMGTGSIGFLAGIYHPGRDYEAAGTPFFREAATWQQGIHLGGNAAAQRVFSFDDLTYAQQSQYEPEGIGYLKEGDGSSTRRILLPGIGAKQ